MLELHTLSPLLERETGGDTSLPSQPRKGLPSWKTVVKSVVSLRSSSSSHWRMAYVRVLRDGLDGGLRYKG